MEDGLAKVIIDKIAPIINKILGIVQVFGIFLTIISVSYFGFTIVVSNSKELLNPLGLKSGISRGKKPDGSEQPTDQAQMRYWMWNVLIGALLLFASSTVVKITFKLLW